MTPASRVSGLPPLFLLTCSHDSALGLGFAFTPGAFEPWALRWASGCGEARPAELFVLEAAASGSASPVSGRGFWGCRWGSRGCSPSFQG